MLLLICLLNIKDSIKKETLPFIPLEFKDLKEKALSSARKRINKIFTDEAILPNKPYIRDEFIGFVNNPFYAKTVSELKGYAISDEKKHIAVIINRDTEIGNEMMKENSMFSDEKTKSVYSLFFKYADDGEVAIYNITKIDEFQIFDRFQLTLPKYSIDKQCTNTGKNFGRRCWIEGKFNWQDDKDMPDKKTLKIDEFEADLYFGIKARAEASMIIKKTGSFNLQTEMDLSFDFSGGVGFYINEFNTSKYNKNISSEQTMEIISKDIPIFFTSLNIKALLVFQPVLEKLDAIVSKPVSLIKVFKLHLRNSLVVSTKHQKTSESEKEFHIETLLNNGDVDNNDDFESEVSIDGSISLRAGIRGQLTFGQTYFSIEGGAKPFFDFNFTRNTTKCTAPAIFGHLVPTINLYIITKGEIKIGFIRLFKAYKEKLFKIISFGGKFGSCLYDDRNSQELDDDLIDDSNDPLKILLFDNFSSTADGFYSIANNLSDSRHFYNKYLFLERENKVFNPNKAFLITNENDKYTNLRSFVTFNNSFNGSSDITDLLNITENLHYDANLKLNQVNFNYSLSSYKSRPVSYGKSFTIDNDEEYINSKPKGITEFPFNLGLIYNINKSYHAHYDDYDVINEYEDALHDELIDDVYQSSDYTGFNISIELNNKSDTEHCVNRTVLRVYHTQEENDVHLLYVTIFGCNNSEINEYFNSSTIFVPLIETKGNVNCIRITYLNDSFYLTRNDLIKPNNEITIKTYHFTYTIKVSYPEYPYYIFQLNNPKVPFSNKQAKGIVARFFQFRNQNVVPFDGIPQTIIFQMGKNEVYGIYRGLFVRHGENLSNLYALIYMPDLQPLTNDAQMIESDSYFIKLIENSTLIKRKSKNDDNSYDIIIPFRRRSLEVNYHLEITLNMIFQAEESSKSDPYCSLFSTFSFKPNVNMYAGCIHNFSSNSWEHFTSLDYDIIREQEISIPNSKYKLHCINLKKNPEENIDSLTVYATLKYVQFPTTSRFLIIENETAVMLNKYCNGEYLQVICHRCSKIRIERDEFEMDMIRSPYLNYLFMIMIDDSFNSSFPLVAYCDTNETAFCTFEIDISDDGYTLVEYNPNFTVYYSVNNHELFDETPGAEEIYQLNQYSTSTNESIDYYELNNTNQTRIDSGFKRQILYRDDVILATKPWYGPINKRIIHMENNINHLTLTYCSVFENSVEISLHDNLDNDIPFSSKNFYQSTNETNNFPFSQIGIIIDFNNINDSDFIVGMNAEGHIVANKSLFDHKKIKNINLGEKFELIDLPVGCYSIKNGGSTDTEVKSKSKKIVVIVGSVVSGVVIGLLTALVIYCCCIKKHKCCCKKKKEENTLNQNLNDNNDIFPKENF